MAGQVIRMFLTDGNPSGLRTVEIMNMTILGTFFPRTQMDRFIARREASEKPGVYMLFGARDADPDQKMLYIGEGDPVLPRIVSHGRKKDFWNEAVVFSSKDDYLTKTQIKFLEAELYELARDAARAELDNSQVPTRPNISEAERAAVLQFLEAIKFLLLALGIEVLKPRTIAVKPEMTENTFELKMKNVSAQMAVVDDKYVVLKGSTAVLENSPSIPPALVKLRQELVERGIMKDEGNGMYTFMQNEPFNSPSYAAVAIVGGAANGRKLWKCNGKSLNDLEQEMSSGEEEC